MTGTCSDKNICMGKPKGHLIQLVKYRIVTQSVGAKKLAPPDRRTLVDSQLIRERGVTELPAVQAKQAEI